MTGETGSRLQIELADGADFPEALADQVDGHWAHTVARAMASLTDASTDVSSSIPEKCRLLEVTGLTAPSIARILERWQADEGPRLTIGVGADGPLTLDLGQDGPHALIAGTTGAGKSELLQTLVAGLAINNSPQDVSFILIDYKGGAAFAECARLPHTAGLVTDLDGHLTQRALRSLTAELRRREALFAAAGAADLGAYRASPAQQRSRLGRLVLVVDEFAALADELPDLLTGLVAIAQRGRSLGVHLVLATQRPAGVVSAEIQANLALRIALRVTDPAESAAVIGSDASSRIGKDFPGRAVVRTGTTLTEFQTARVGAPVADDQDEITVRRLDEWGRRVGAGSCGPASEPTSTDLTMLADTMRAAAEQAALTRPASPWLPPLPPLVALDVLLAAPAPTGRTSIPIGVVDLPDEQAHARLTVDLHAGGPMLIAGPARSGRTTALRSLAAAALHRADTTPASDRTDVAIYVIDCAGGALGALADVARCGAYVTRDHPETISRLLRRLGDELSARQASSSAGPGSPRPPALLLLLDGWENFVTASEAHDGGTAIETLHALLRESASVGLTIAIAGGRASLSGRMTSMINRTFLLGTNSPTDLALLGIGSGLGRASNAPATIAPGRAVRGEDGNEVQFAFAGADPSPESQQAALATAAATVPTTKSVPPIRIRPLPTVVRRPDVQGALVPPGHILLGVGGDGAEPVSLDLFAGDARWLVAGPPRSGRSTLLATVLAQATAAGCRAVVAAPRRSPLVGAGETLGVDVVLPDAQVPERPAHGKWLILIDDNESFLDTVAGGQFDELALGAGDGSTAVVVCGRADEMAMTYRGLAATVRRSQSGILLRPGPGDGDLLGVKLPRVRAISPPGRGLLVAHQPHLCALGADEVALPVQVALW